MGRHRGRIAWIAFVLAFAIFYLLGRWAAGTIEEVRPHDALDRPRHVVEAPTPGTVGPGDGPQEFLLPMTDGGA